MKSDNNETASISTEEEEEELDSNRVENIHWCTCQQCFNMRLIIESKCCHETTTLLNSR